MRGPFCVGVFDLQGAALEGAISQILRYKVFLLVAFSMYDMNGNGKISRDELLVILNMMVGANITPEQVCGSFEFQFI